MSNLKDKVKEKTTYSKEKSNELGEVFTPVKLIEEMCDSLPDEIWSDENKKWLDPCAGKGNMPSVIIEKLMIGLSKKIPDETKRYKHILENMIYMCEFQRLSAETIEEIFNPNDNLNLNLFCGDTLTMPEDFFDISYNERQRKYPENSIIKEGKFEIPIIDKWMQKIMNLAKKCKA